MGYYLTRYDIKNASYLRVRTNLYFIPPPSRQLTEENNITHSNHGLSMGTGVYKSRTPLQGTGGCLQAVSGSRGKQSCGRSITEE
ncbi:hypothetical protein J6590_039154 [Homalodisca vitripennis]|nr:hypothetical protein J6590_039154 [Homalodisca vitripennis]